MELMSVSVAKLLVFTVVISVSIGKSFQSDFELERRVSRGISEDLATVAKGFGDRQLRLEQDEGGVEVEVSPLERETTNEEIAVYVMSCLAVVLTALCCFFCCKHCCCDANRSRTVVYQQMPMEPFGSTTVTIINHTSENSSENINGRAGDEVTRENKVRFELDGGKYPGASPQ